MANSTISSLPTAGGIDGTNDFIIIQTASPSATNKINRNSFLGITSSPVGITDTQTLSAKTLTNPTINGATLSGTLSGTYTIGGTPTFPSSVVTLTGSQTLTNKTLTSPVITGGTISNPAITVDSISGFTSSTVVTVANLQVSNGVLNTANSVITSNITDAAVTPAKLVAGSGTGWAYQTWTPTFTNITVGNGTLTAKYVQIGKTVICRISFVLGSTSSVGTAPLFTLPVTAITYPNLATVIDDLGGISILDSGVGQYDGKFVMQSTTQARILVRGSAGTYVNPVDITSAVPMTWTTSDAFSGFLIYEAA